MPMNVIDSGGFDRTAAVPLRFWKTTRSGKPGLGDLRRTATWPLVLACGFLIFVSASSFHLVVSSQSASDRVTVS